MEDIRKASKSKLINLGILINSGGIIGILSISKTKPISDLKYALYYFIASFVCMIVSEFITMKSAHKSLYDIIKLDLSDKAAKIEDITYSKTWVRNLIYFFSFGSFAMTVYALKSCFNYLG